MSQTQEVSSYVIGAASGLAVLRIGLGLWWLESWRHKDKRGWLQTGSGIDWAAGFAAKHRWAFVRTGFEKTVLPRKRLMAWVVVLAELAIGLGLVLGFLTPIAAVGGLLLNVLYFTLMIHDWAEQGQNAMMALIAVVVIVDRAWQAFSLDHLWGLF